MRSETLQDIIDIIRGKKTQCASQEIPVATDTAISNDMIFKVNPHTFWTHFNTMSWEPQTFRFYQKYTSPLHNIIDIGGWMGPTMLIAYSFNPNKISVVEGDPANFQILKNNCYNNYLEDKVDLTSICIAEKSNEITSFGYNDENVKDSSTKGLNCGTTKVKTITLIDYLKTKDINNTNIIKIDIEGGEQHIATGLDYISKFKNICVLLSLHPPFFDNKEKTAALLTKEFEKFDIFNEEDEKISLEEVKQKLLEEIPTYYENKTGRFFTIILKTRDFN